LVLEFHEMAFDIGHEVVAAEPAEETQDETWRRRHPGRIIS
jgi:hypothetical protein